MGQIHLCFLSSLTCLKSKGVLSTPAISIGIFFIKPDIIISILLLVYGLISPLLESWFELKIAMVGRGDGGCLCSSGKILYC